MGSEKKPKVLGCLMLDVIMLFESFGWKEIREFVMIRLELGQEGLWDRVPFGHWSLLSLGIDFYFLAVLMTAAY